MYLNLLNRKSGEATQFKFDAKPLKQIKQIAAKAAASTAHYFICVVAETIEDIDFVQEHFANVPLPHSEAKQAIWTGDLATFIVLNYPPPDKDSE